MQKKQQMIDMTLVNIIELRNVKMIRLKCILEYWVIATDNAVPVVWMVTHVSVWLWIRLLHLWTAVKYAEYE